MGKASPRAGRAALVLQQLEVAGRARRRRGRAGARGDAGGACAGRRRRPRPRHRRARRGRRHAGRPVAGRRPCSDLTILTVIVCALGDLTLDVVRLAAPLAVGGDTDAEIRVAPGGQAANVAAWAASSARLAVRREARRRRHRAARAGGARGAGCRGPRARGGSQRRDLLPRRAGRRTVDGGRSRCCGGPPGGGARGGVARGLQPPLRVRVRAHARARPWSSCPGRRARPYRRREGQRRSRSWSAIRDVGPECFRTVVEDVAPDVVFANEDEESIIGGPIPGAAWILKHGARGCTFDGDERAALPVEEVVDSTGAGMRSPPASSSAGPTSRSRRLRDASPG